MNKKVFLASPIAGFDNENEYFLYREQMRKISLTLLRNLKKSSIYGAFLSVSDFNSYDPPEISALNDIQHLEEVDYFILFYPTKVATSALTELGIALGLNKQILIITPNKQILPYMVQGLPSLKNKSVKIIEKDIVNEDVLEEILAFLGEIFERVK